MTVEAAPRTSLVRAIEIIAEEADADGLTLAELLEKLGERAFGAVLFALALPCCIPFLYVIPQIVAVPMMVFAAQMAMGRNEPWLPERFRARRLDKQGLERMARGARRFFGWADRIASPRLTFLAAPAAERVIGVMLVLFCASILIPFPSTNTVPGFAVALTALGLLERDGVLVIAGLILGVVWLSLLAAAAVFMGTYGFSAIIDFLRGLVSSS